MSLNGEENHIYLHDNNGVIMPQLSTGDPGVQGKLLTQNDIQ